MTDNKKETIKITSKIFTDIFVSEFNKKSLLNDFKSTNAESIIIGRPTYNIREFIILRMVSSYLDLKTSKQNGYTAEISSNYYRQ